MVTVRNDVMCVTLFGYSHGYHDVMDVTLFGYSHGFRSKRRHGSDVIRQWPWLPLETTSWMRRYSAIAMVTV